MDWVLSNPFRVCNSKEGDYMLTINITDIEIRKIFDNHDRKLEYLENVFNALNINSPLLRTSRAIDDCIIDTWEYELSKSIIRDMFFHSEKFLHSCQCKDEIDYLINNWNQHNLGEIEWPFSAMTFDAHVARLNRLDCSEEEKDDILAFDTIKFRRIKQINTCRNDYIEGLIVFHNDNIIPTFRHSRGVDFYIDGMPFDQKVSRSVGRNFIEDYDDYYQVALNHPELVAKSLYEHQDEERFDDQPRLYVVYLDSDVTSESIERCINESNFGAPINIEFEYTHSNNNVLSHRTECYIILLHN